MSNITDVTMMHLIKSLIWVPIAILIWDYPLLQILQSLARCLDRPVYQVALSLTALKNQIPGFPFGGQTR